MRQILLFCFFFFFFLDYVFLGMIQVSSEIDRSLADPILTIGLE